MAQQVTHYITALTVAPGDVYEQTQSTALHNISLTLLEMTPNILNFPCYHKTKRAQQSFAPPLIPN